MYLENSDRNQDTVEGKHLILFWLNTVAEMVSQLKGEVGFIHNWEWTCLSSFISESYLQIKLFC